MTVRPGGNGCPLIVLYISRHPGSSQEEITGFYALDKASVTRDTRRLEDLGHIERNIIPEMAERMLTSQIVYN